MQLLSLHIATRGSVESHYGLFDSLYKKELDGFVASLLFDKLWVFVCKVLAVAKRLTVLCVAHRYKNWTFRQRVLSGLHL